MDGKKEDCKIDLSTYNPRFDEKHKHFFSVTLEPTSTLNELFVDCLNADLQNEYDHMHFYLRAGTLVRGMNRFEVSEFFLEEAVSELKHCEEFSRKVIWLDGSPIKPVIMVEEDCKLMDCYYACDIAYNKELKVVNNFHRRLEMLDNIQCMEASVLRVFYEDQLTDSLKTVAELKEVLG